MPAAVAPARIEGQAFPRLASEGINSVSRGGELFRFRDSLHMTTASTRDIHDEEKLHGRGSIRVLEVSCTRL